MAEPTFESALQELGKEEFDRHYRQVFGKPVLDFTFRDAINVIKKSNKLVQIFQFGQVRFVQGEDLEIVITKRVLTGYETTTHLGGVY